MRRTGLLIASLVVALVAAGCRSPGATQLGPEGLGFPPPDPRLASAPAEELAVEPLEQDGVRGGRVAFTVDRSPEEVLEMLLDFEGADGHRSWARKFELLERSQAVVRARWTFAGRLGMNPSVVIELTPERHGAATVVTYRVTEPAFGLAAFFGDYWILPLDTGGSIVVERVFIDSGVVFANASARDIAAGLREDARRLREWAHIRWDGEPDGEGTIPY